MSENTFVSVYQFEEYLLTRLDASTNERLLYVTTRTVASELGCSVKYVGQLFKRHKTRSEHFDIERWSKAGREGGAKWKVQRREQTQEPERIDCPHCEQTFFDRAARDGHLNIHTSE